MADIIIAPQTGPEAVSGLANPKAQLAQRQIVNMLTTGLAIRDGRVYSNLRVDVQADNSHWAERQIAIVMAATDCTRSEAKAALASCHQHCRTAILMLLSGLDAARARAADATSQSPASRPARSTAQQHDHSRPLTLQPGRARLSYAHGLY